MKNNKISEKKIDKIIKLTVKNESYREISRKVGVSMGTVWRYQKLYCQPVKKSNSKE